MRRIYTTETVALAWHMRNVLEQEDIKCTVKNENLYSVAGELPITECMPEVWVIDDAEYFRAEKIIKELEADTGGEKNGSPASALPDWNCSHCGESNESNFDICWNCQKFTENE